MTLDEKYRLRDTIITMCNIQVVDTDTGEPIEPIPALRPIIDRARACGCDEGQLFVLCWQSQTDESWTDIGTVIRSQDEVDRLNAEQRGEPYNPPHLN